MTEHYADELVVSIDEILNPASDIKALNSWKVSRLDICATAVIIERLNELGQMDLVSLALSSLQTHIDSLTASGCPV